MDYHVRHRRSRWIMNFQAIGNCVANLGAGAIGSFVAWRSQRPFQALFELRAAKRRFTGSYEVPADATPETIWLDDTVPVIDPGAWRLSIVDGRGSYELRLDQLASAKIYAWLTLGDELSYVKADDAQQQARLKEMLERTFQDKLPRGTGKV